MKLFLLIASLLFSFNTYAKGKGGFSLGVMYGLASTGSQTKINEMITDANTAYTISTGQMSSGTELIFQGSYRFKGMVEWLIRPSYFTASSTGSTAGGDNYNYEAFGMTLFSIWRFNILENKMFKFFANTGLGWAFIDTSIQENTYTVKASGNAMGVLGGLGAEFCFTQTHCMTIEGNARLLPVERLIVSSASSASSGNHSSIVAGEWEYNNLDVGLSLSGLVGTIGYTMRF